MDTWEDWQRPYQYGTLVIWPPSDVRENVNSQREKYDPVSQSYCEAHITVTQPLCRWLDEEEWDRVRIVLAGFESFEIAYGPLNSFLPYPCIWYEVKPRERVLEIRNALHQTGYFNLEMKHPKNFIPHMTITEGLSGPAVDESLLQLLQGESGTGSFKCEGLAYIVPDDSFRLQVRSILLLAHLNP
jgi:2'-5' RNA ligase